MPLKLRVGGLASFSSVDYPGRLAAVVFCRGCPWRCAYCHNPGLRSLEGPRAREWPEVARWLRGRQGLLDAVVFSGGEPTLQDALPGAMREARSLGFAVGLHTAGVYPERLAAVLPLADWVGLDVKAPFGRYAEVCGAAGGGERVLESLRLLVASGVDHECRTTVHPALFTARELAGLSEAVLALGARRHILQAFRPDGCRDAGLAAAQESAAVRLAARARALAPRSVLRGSWRRRPASRRSGRAASSAPCQRLNDRHDAIADGSAGDEEKPGGREGDGQGRPRTE